MQEFNIYLTLVPWILIACWAICDSFSRYSWAARELYFCCASEVVQLCCWKKVFWKEQECE